MNAILTVPRNLMKNVISGVFNKTNTSMPLQSFTKATKQAYKAECVVNFNFIKHTAYNNMSRSDNNVELLITLVKNNQQCLQGFRVEIVNHFIIISTLWIHSEDTGWIFNLKSCWGLRQAPLCKRKMFFHGFRRVMLWYCRYVMEWFVVSMPLIEGIRPDVGAKQGLHFSPTLKHYTYFFHLQ